MWGWGSAWHSSVYLTETMLWMALDTGLRIYWTRGILFFQEDEMINKWYVPERQRAVALQ